MEAKKYMFEEELAVKLFRQMVESLDYLHGLRIVHRDLNPKNVFVDRNMNIKLGDFGLGTYFTLQHYNLFPVLLIIVFLRNHSKIFGCG